MVRNSLVTMKSCSTFLLFLSIVSPSPPNLPKQRLRIQVTNFLCNHDKAKIKDVMCVYKPARNAIGTFSFGMTITEPTPEVWMTLKSYDRTSAGLYQNEHLVTKINVCEITKNQNFMVTLVYNLFLKQFMEDMMQDCPYKGRVEAVNKTIGSIDAFLDLYPNLPTGDYKYVFSTFDAEHTDKSTFEVHLFVHIKGKFLSGRG